MQMLRGAEEHRSQRHALPAAFNASLTRLMIGFISIHSASPGQKYKFQTNLAWILRLWSLAFRIFGLFRISQFEF